MAGLEFIELCTHLIVLLCELALLVSSCILMKDTVGYSLIYLLYCCLVSNLSGSLVPALNSGVVLLDDGLHLALEHSVAKILCLSNLHTLLCRLDIRHCVLSLKFKIMLHEGLRGCPRCRLPYIYRLYHTSR